MRQNNRRRDIETAGKLQDVRNLMRAFGSSAGERFGKMNLMPSALIQTAISSKYERRQRLRRVTDRPEGADPIPFYR